MMNKLISQIVTTPRLKKGLPVSLRKHKDEMAYHKAKQTGQARKPLKDEKAIREWKKWKIINNEFPYTAAFDTHHMLIPKRQVRLEGLSDAEREELSFILSDLNEHYDCMMLNFQKKQTIGNHFHLHLLNYKKKRKDVKL